jgi:hypothetical protein
MSANTAQVSVCFVLLQVIKLRALAMHSSISRYLMNALQDVARFLIIVKKREKDHSCIIQTVSRLRAAHKQSAVYAVRQDATLGLPHLTVLCCFP